MNQIAMGMIRFYQTAVGPFLGPRCRFYPSCSRYAYQAFANYHFSKALRMSATRICKCGPWHPGGVDLP